MQYARLNDHIGVAGQIAVAQVAEVAAAGYRVLVNNRPDGEEPGQPTAAEIGEAAAAAGLQYHHLPVSAMNFPGPDVAQMARLFDDSEQAVFAFCRSGTRCTNLWVATRDESSRSAAAQRALSLGFDLGMAARFL
jgi:uncharacterized protein (TIGR01244 family)